VEIYPAEQDKFRKVQK